MSGHIRSGRPRQQSTQSRSCHCWWPLRPSSSSPAPANSSFLALSASLPRPAAVEWAWALQGAQLSARLLPVSGRACWWCKRSSCFSTALQMEPFAVLRLASRVGAPLAASTGSTSASRSMLHASHQARAPCHPCAHGGSAQARPAPCLTVLHRVRAAPDGDTLVTADALGGLAVWRLFHPQSGSFRLEPRGRLATHATPVCSVACDSSQQVWEPFHPLSTARSRVRDDSTLC